MAKTVAPFVTGAALVLGTGFLLGVRHVSRSRSQSQVPSPRESLIPHLTSAQTASLAYPPDLMPGARDITTPYGIMRAYEWGPKDGKRIIMVHGDSTPSPMFWPIADSLAKAGCRVLLFGRSENSSVLILRLTSSQTFGDEDTRIPRSTSATMSAFSSLRSFPPLLPRRFPGSIMPAKAFRSWASP